jgi:hypothetical protein
MTVSVQPAAGAAATTVRARRGLAVLATNGIHPISPGRSG